MNDAPTEQPAAAGIFGGYTPDNSFYDEVFSGTAMVRPEWRDLLSAVEGIGDAELNRRWRQAQREIHEAGIAFNAFDDASGGARPWALDLVPQLITADEWSTLVAGLQQRALLLNRLLADLYGAQESLQRGLLPAEWLYAHPGFRRVFCGQHPHDATFLHFYAADLARAPDGRWWVVGDRTDAPLGLGYALENRIVTSRMLPDTIRQFQVERLAPFFRTLQETLRGLAPAHRDNPHIVLLSHGPSGPNYFEDAYLARYLGYTLVEGADLAVRDDHVYLKTLAGLLPVDVILRRMSDEFCDPLELRRDAELGVAGLLNAARLGNVAVANALGTSLVESPSLMPFLPGMARAWLGEELAMPSVATWWCGEAVARRHVLSLVEDGQSDRLSIRSAYRVGRQEVLAAENLQDKSRQELDDLLATRPRDLIAQETVQRSTSPAWCGSAPTRWHVGLRVYLVASQSSYHAMPGGLLRLEEKPVPLDLSVLGGNMSKDVWVQAAGPVSQISLLATAKQPVVLRRRGAELPSRVADNLFWFGRRIERAQGSCRLLRTAVSRLTGERELEGSGALASLIHCLAAQGQIEPGFAVEGIKDRLPTIANVLPSNVLDEQQAGSLRSTFAQAYRNASLVRDRLSLDTWRIVHHVERLLTSASAATRATRQPSNKDRRLPFRLVELDELLDELVVHLSALDGLISESMTRSPAWRFLELGRRVERSLHVVSLVQSLPAAAAPEEGRALEAMLEVSESIMTYRSRYMAAVHRAAALDLLLIDETNPRSLAYQLAAIADHVTNLPRDDSKPLGTPESRIAASLLHAIRMLDVEDLDAVRGGEHVKLSNALKRVADQLPKLSDLISHRYLIHAGVPQQMGKGRRES